MAHGMFALDFSRWEVICLSIIPAVINIGVFAHTFFCLPHNRTSVYFSLFLFFLALCQTFDGFVRLSTSAETALQWARLDAVPWLMIMPFGILFSLRVIGLKEWLKNRMLLLLIFLPTIILEFVTIAHLDAYVVVPSPGWHWVVNPLTDLPTTAIFTWLTVQAAVVLALLWVSYFRSRRVSADGSASLLLAVGFTVPFIGGVVMEVLFPLVFELDSIPVSTSLITAFSIASIVVLKKSKLFDFSPRHQWDTIVQSINEGILIVNNDDRIMYANSAFCSMVEYTYEEMRGRIAYELLIDTKEDRRKIEAVIMERRQGISGSYELLIKSKSGKSIWLLTNGTPYMSRTGKVIGSIGIHTDITYLKNAQQEISISKRKLDIFIEESQLCIHITDPVSKRIVYANPAFCELLGYNKEQIQDLHVSDFIGHGRENIDDRIRQVIRDKRIGATKRQWKTKNGKMVHVLVNTYFQENPDGSSAIYVAAQNITSLVETEQKLIESNSELEFYIYRISHELRAPLASILGLTNVGRFSIKDTNALEITNKIELSAQKLDNTLSALIKSMSIRKVSEFEDLIDPGQLCNEIAAAIESRFGQPGFSINVNDMLRVPLVSNKFLLQTIFHNIAENACKYQRPETKFPRLDVTIYRQDENVVIEFRDNGIGIPLEIQSRIFEMYFKGTYETEGTGLGLYLVKKAVEKLNGEIKVKSNPGNGTLITVVISGVTHLQAGVRQLDVPVAS